MNKNLFVNEIYTIGNGWKEVNKKMEVSEIISLFKTAKQIAINGKDYSKELFEIELKENNEILAESKIRIVPVFENDKAILIFDRYEYAKDGYYWEAKEKKDGWNYKSFRTNNFKTANKRFMKYSE